MGDNNSNANNNANAPKKKPAGNFFRMRSRYNANKRDSGPKLPTFSVQIPKPTSASTSQASTVPIPSQAPANTSRAPANSSPANSAPSTSTSRPNLTTLRANALKASPDGKYFGWELYFPETAFDPNLPHVRKIKAFEEHIHNYPSVYKLKNIRENLWFALHLVRVTNDADFMAKYPDFQRDLNESPEVVLLCAGLAAHQQIQLNLPPISASQSDDFDGGTKMSLLTIRARVQGHTPIVSLSSFRQDVYNRLVTVRGTVVRANQPELINSWIAFRCSQCNEEQAIRQHDRFKANVPSSCKSNHCRARSNFRMLKSSVYTRTEPYQVIRLQESVQSVKGQVPKTIEVDLAHELVDAVYPGDDVTVTGIIKVRLIEQGGFNKGGRGFQAGMHKFYISAVSIVSNKNTMAARNSDFNKEELEMIQDLKELPNLFKLFVHSLCPRIFGHEMVKAGLILSLFGGSGEGPNSDNALGDGRRSEIHVLVVGDPGLGKSLLIQSCANVSPRGIFVCGNSATNAGLTVSIRHDKNSDGSLEAGALVLADQGVCCLDEFDKMRSNYQSLLQVMEQQSVSVAKAGVLCALPARTTILAAANPSGGHYDKGRTVSENLRTWPTLLSRFDLVFILMDRADAHLDSLLTAHVQALRQQNENHRNAPTSTVGLTQMQPNKFVMPNQHLTPEQQDAPLHERLRITNPLELETLPTEVMQKYIMYARKNCFPTISPEATEVLGAFYSEMRTTRPGIDSVPVTTRQLEALLRMTQARARVELAEEATVAHAQDVLAILRYTMVDVLSTDRGTLQMNRRINGSGMSHTTKVKKFLEMLQDDMKHTYTRAELRQFAQIMGFESNLNQIIDSLNVQGFLINKGNGVWAFNT